MLYFLEKNQCYKIYSKYVKKWEPFIKYLIAYFLKQINLKTNLIIQKAYYSHDIREGSYKFLAICWETIGDIWHGHEIIGFENLPETGPALLIYYHAAMPIDFYYVHSKTILYKNRRMKVVADRFLFKVPGKI